MVVSLKLLDRVKKSSFNCPCSVNEHWRIDDQSVGSSRQRMIFDIIFLGPCSDSNRLYIHAVLIGLGLNMHGSLRHQSFLIYINRTSYGRIVMSLWLITNSHA